MATNEPVLEALPLDLTASSSAQAVPVGLSDVRRGAQAYIYLFNALFWTTLLAIHTSQVSLSDGAVDWQSIRWRAALHGLAFVLSLPLGWVIQRTLERTLARRLLSIFATSLVAAIVYASASRLVWGVLLGGGGATPPVLAVIINSHYNLVLFLLWSAFCSAILYALQARERERRLLEAQALAHEAELKMLRYQINPHFLFNTLNAVSALIVTGQALAAEQMVAKLASFFRTALSRESTAKITLAEEIRVQLEYLDIELTRFPDRLRWSTTIAADVANALVPHLILQPLFENAIKHGVARSGAPVEIRIEARREQGRLLVSIANDLPPKDDERRSLGAGVGLENVARRLGAFYGEAAELHTGSRDGRFVVELRLPLELTL